MQAFIAVITTSAFVWLATYSYYHKHMVTVFNGKQANAIAEVYGLSTDDVIKPVNLWEYK